MGKILTIIGLIALAVIVLTGCIPAEAATPTPRPAPDLLRERGKFFSAAGECAVCHSRLVNESGEDISMDAGWRGSMMANSARDPYFLAGVRNEVETFPQYQAEIEAKCSLCHYPMAHITAESEGMETAIFGNGWTNPDNQLHSLGMDGVSCALCHQVQPDGFGQPESFTGHFAIDLETLPGQRQMYGPFDVQKKMEMVMQNASGFGLEQADHLGKSEMCATCHTLYTPYVTVDGELSSTLFPEQVPYLEWLNSSFAEDGVPCQECHMPRVSGQVLIASVGGQPRESIAEHFVRGSNYYMTRMLEENAQEVGATAGDEHFWSTEENTLAMMEQRTATLNVEAEQSGGQLALDVLVESSTGHKLPTSYPSRRVWLHVTVADRSGAVLFESGGWESNGLIRENDNDEDGRSFEPHYTVINDESQVQIYELIFLNDAGEVSTSVLSAAQQVKDNRILPPGFDIKAADEDIAIYGAALDDADFTAGQDAVVYEIDLGEVKGKLTVTVELLYQSIAYRWAENLRAGEGEEISTFMGYYDALANEPVLIARREVVVK
jgi:hypothetical protein